MAAKNSLVRTHGGLSMLRPVLSILESIFLLATVGKLALLLTVPFADGTKHPFKNHDIVFQNSSDKLDDETDVVVLFHTTFLGTFILGCRT